MYLYQTIHWPNDRILFDLCVVCAVLYLCIATEDDSWRVVETFGFDSVNFASVWFGKFIPSHTGLYTSMSLPATLSQ